jgi:hypothetical protein
MGDAATSTPAKNNRHIGKSTFSVVCASLSILLVSGLAIFHVHGYFVLRHLISSGNEVVIPVYNITTADHFPLSVSMMTERVREFAFLSCALVGVVTGLCFRQQLAWGLALVVCGILILMRLSMMNGKIDEWKAVHWYFIYYCIFTVATLLLATPAFLRRPAKPTH